MPDPREVSPGWARRHRRSWFTTWLVGVLLSSMLAACGSDAPPSQRLADAFRATFADSFAFDIALDADPRALAGLGDQAASAASTLRGVSLRGVVDGEDTQLELLALGGSVAEIRQVGEVLYLRAGIVDLFAGVGLGDFAAERELLDGLAAAGVPPVVLDAVTAVYDGQWIGLEGGLDALAVAEVADEPPGGGASPSATTGVLLRVLGTDLDGFFERFVEVTEGADGDFTVELLLRDLLRASAEVGVDLGVGPAVGLDDLEEDLARLPSGVPAVVTVDDGVVTGLLFDAAASIRRMGLPVQGTLALDISLADHGRAGPVGTPGDALVVPQAAVAEAVAALTGR